MLVFAEGGKPEYPEKNPRSRDENQQQTQPTYDAETGNRTQATLVGGECSHHCTIPAPRITLCTHKPVPGIIMSFPSVVNTVSITVTVDKTTERTKLAWTDNINLEIQLK